MVVISARFTFRIAENLLSETGKSDFSAEVDHLIIDVCCFV